MKDEDIDLSEIPEVTAEQIARASLRVGGKPVARRKVRVNIYLDAEVVARRKVRVNIYLDAEEIDKTNCVLQGASRRSGLSDISK